MLGKLYLFMVHCTCIGYFFLLRGVSFSKKLKIKGFPLIQISKGSSIDIGENVLLNSSNRGYHVNMFGPVKLIADGDSSIITIGSNSRIHGTCIHAKKRVVIGENCLIAANTQIIDSNAHELEMDNPENRINTIDQGKEVIIESNVWIGANVLILPGVTIGSGSVVAANSVITKSFPGRSIIAGNPAKVIKEYHGE